MTPERLSQLLKGELYDLHYLVTGQIGDIYQAQLQEQSVMIKTTAEDRDDLLIEARMLDDLRVQGLRVPKVITSTKEALVMEAITPCKDISYDKEIEAARAIASLHQVSNESRMYGYYYNTTIASFIQNNEQTQYNWGLFLAQMRILPMARLCYDKGVLQKSLLDRLEHLCIGLCKRIDMSQITPSLLHGDIWSGNILYEKSGMISIKIQYSERRLRLKSNAIFLQNERI